MEGLALSIAVPDTFTSNYQSLLQRSIAIGELARACAIFKVADIYIYRERGDRPLKRVAGQISKVLSYLETPQYMRKHLFGKDPDLRYVGMLPPLRTPHHKLKEALEELEIGSYREGLTKGWMDGYTHIDIGLDHDALLAERVRDGRRISLKIIDKRGSRIMVERVERKEIPHYWGYRVHNTSSTLLELLKRTPKDTVILTSRKGVNISSLLEELKTHLRGGRRILVVFGGVHRGVYDILRDEGVAPEEVGDFVINTIPGQGTATVRIEEAVYITLGALNIIAHL